MKQHEDRTYWVEVAVVGLVVWMWYSVWWMQRVENILVEHNLW